MEHLSRNFQKRKKQNMKRLSFITQFKIEFLLPFTSCRKVLGKMPDMWHMKSVSSETPNLKWSVLRCVPPYSNISKKCLLCLHVNLKELLNKRFEFICKYHHASKFLLKNYTGNDFR